MPTVGMPRGVMRMPPVDASTERPGWLEVVAARYRGGPQTIRQCCECGALLDVNGNCLEQECDPAIGRNAAAA
jgi:hypothetical protein